MQTLQKYLSKDYLITFGMTLAVFTFVMYIGAVIKAIDLMSRGVSGVVILKIFGYNIPYILSFSIPISSLTAVLLLFSRLSFDGEITAMKACGLSMRQICWPVVLLSGLLSLVCIYINAYAAPNSHFSRRQLLSNVGVEDPVELLQEGMFIRDFPGIQIYVGKKLRNKVQDVIVNELDSEGKLRRKVRAESGVITADPDREKFIIDLYKVRIETSPDAREDAEFSYIVTDHYEEELDYGSLRKKGVVRRRKRDHTLPGLFQGIRDVRSLHDDVDEAALRKSRMSLMVETSQRFAMSFCCLAFALIGIPLGMKSRRRESSVGIMISLAVVFVFYFFVILADSLVNKPFLRPDLILWIPIFAAQVVGLWLIAKQD